MGDEWVSPHLALAVSEQVTGRLTWYHPWGVGRAEGMQGGDIGGKTEALCSAQYFFL